MQEPRKIGQGFIQPLEPVALAGGADNIKISVRIAPEQFKDIGFGLYAARIELQGHQLRQGNQFQGTARTYNHGGATEGILDHNGKTPAEVHDLQQAEVAGDIDDAAKRIGAVRLMKFRRETGLAERVQHPPQGGRIGADAKVYVAGVADIIMGGERDRADHNRLDLLLLEYIGHLLGRTQNGCFWLHGSLILRYCGGLQPCEFLAHGESLHDALLYGHAAEARQLPLERLAGTGARNRPRKLLPRRCGTPASMFSPFHAAIVPHERVFGKWPAKVVFDRITGFAGWSLRGGRELRMSCFAGAYVADFLLRRRMCRGCCWFESGKQEGRNVLRGKRATDFADCADAAGLNQESRKVLRVWMLWFQRSRCASALQRKAQREQVVSTRAAHRGEM